MSNSIDLETVGCDDHHNGRIAELSGSLQLRDYPTDTVRLSCAKCGRKRQYRQQNLIERYRADIRLLDLPEEIAQCIRPWPGPGASAMFQSLRPVPFFAGPASQTGAVFTEHYRSARPGFRWPSDIITFSPSAM